MTIRLKDHVTLWVEAPQGKSTSCQLPLLVAIGTVEVGIQ